ncbi:MAG: Gfo/Idh/MocA family oxidoreductase [Chitinophagaceae bacterium]|nr:Gfo/Idh/MocA family oxidoreductase [Chitinophagaceae bacterium]
MKQFFSLIFITILTGWIIIADCFDVRAQSTETSPLRLAVAGTTHGHVSWILNRKNKTDIQLVGIYEPNTELAERQAKQFGLNKELFYTDLKKMLDAVKPEAVVAFGSIYEHLAVVENCAPKGIHVMVEKPLAASLDHAMQMEALAKKHNIHLLTNYETSWYPTTEKTYQFLNDSNAVGKIRKAVFHHGHQGPKEIGVSKEFLGWLTDPVQNGGGAIIDFGCYGANIMTYLMKGAEPLSVMAVTKQFKPAVYPRVDDEATIIVTYPDAQCIIQASWNWPFGRKDMEVYGETGYIIAQNSQNILFRNKVQTTEKAIQVNVSDVGVYQDPFSYFADVIRKKITVPEYGLYSLHNNMTVVKILQSAKESANTGKIVLIKK